ncbi:double-stranded RNA-specific editase 1 [Galendromus occidentalis]|uniref:Double-stranded RNA-specific editase 1 n=1 Tax=Galendromus occidentalis TaxID=34638 RepID=A0AAJ6QKK7_9ACAR|nr:double-stranded RNA-specific editase 1 [Galendromus occidentalis]
MGEPTTVQDEKGPSMTDTTAITATTKNRAPHGGGEKRLKVDSKKPKVDKIELSRSPLQYLNTVLESPPAFTLEHIDGPVHEPIFSAKVEVLGRRFVGLGRNKQHAKQVTALEVLKVMLGDPTLTYVGSETPVVMKEVAKPENSSPESSNALVLKVDDAAKTPVQILYELDHTASFRLVKEDSSVLSHRFVFEVLVKGVPYRGFGSNKKKAKHAAARTALYAMTTPIRDTGSLVEEVFSSVPLTLSDTITLAVLNAYEDIMETRPDKKPWKVLAGLVATFDTDNGSPRVLCISTGTKCISGQNLSMTGTAVFDSHGEILTRRCFKYICYCELLRLKFSKGTDDSQGPPRLLELDPSDRKARLAGGVKLHLFISTAPCGDGRLFAPNEDACKVVDEGANKSSRGLLRTKIEGGEGTVRIHGDTVTQTWDGIMNGDRLLTHACSDKVLRWNVLGLQGSLLSKFVNPIYLDSIILGSLYHSEHLSRAVVERVACITENPSLPRNYRLNRPLLAKASSTLERQITKTPSYALNWILGDQTPEVLNTESGIQENGFPSRLSKKVLFDRYKQVAQAWNPNVQPASMTYADAKKNALEYQTAKQCLMKAMGAASLGPWVKKPEECETFF